MRNRGRVARFTTLDEIGWLVAASDPFTFWGAACLAFETWDTFFPPHPKPERDAHSRPIYPLLRIPQTHVSKARHGAPRAAPSDSEFGLSAHQTLIDHPPMPHNLIRHQHTGDFHFRHLPLRSPAPHLATPRARNLFEHSLESMRPRYDSVVAAWVTPEHFPHPVNRSLTESSQGWGSQADNLSKIPLPAQLWLPVAAMCEPMAELQRAT
jgi:hypothetical protein